MKEKLTMPIKKTLNEILEDYQSIELKLLENEGVLDENIEELLNINELELKDKLDGYENFIKYLKNQAEYLKEMETHYNKRRKVLENSIDRYKKSMTRALSLTGIKKIKTLTYNFSLCESEKWTINDDQLTEEIKELLISKGFAELKLKVSIGNIKSEYKDTLEEKPEWIEIEKNEYIRTS